MFIDVEKWQEIFKTLGQHKLRTTLTAFGVFWGIFMLTVLLGAGRGLENGVYDSFPRVSNAIYIWSQGTTQIPYQGLPVGRQIGLEPGDVDAIERNVPTVGWIRGQNSVGIWSGSPPIVTYKAKNGAFSVQGGYEGVEDVNAMRITEGRSINTLDEQQHRKVALIGQRVRDQLFEPGDPVQGMDIVINGISFQVIGVFRSLSNGNQQQEEERIYLPNDTLRYAFNQVGWVGSFVIVPKPGVDAHVTEADVKSYLAQIKKVSPQDKGVFGSFNLQDEYDKIDGLFTGIKVTAAAIVAGDNTCLDNM